MSLKHVENIKSLLTAELGIKWSMQSPCCSPENQMQSCALSLERSPLTCQPNHYKSPQIWLWIICYLWIWELRSQVLTQQVFFCIVDRLSHALCASFDFIFVELSLTYVLLVDLSFLCMLFFAIHKISHNYYVSPYIEPPRNDSCLSAYPSHVAMLRSQWAHKLHILRIFMCDLKQNCLPYFLVCIGTFVSYFCPSMLLNVCTHCRLFHYCVWGLSQVLPWSRHLHNFILLVNL